MEGVILFADNNVLSQNSFENRLFSRLAQEQSLTVLPISSLSDLEATIKTTSTFKALILDWNFNNPFQQVDVDFEDLDIAPQTPENILDSLSIYSLIYVYSQNPIPEEIQIKYKERFPNKIQFNIKNSANIDQECSRIEQDLQLFSRTYSHMELPYLWSQSINQSVQQIFGELEKANSFWIKEIRDTTISDGGDATSDIIEIFNNLLNEDLIQNVRLRAALDNFDYNEEDINEERTAKLYQRIYYSRLTNSAPIMTGDIFQFNDEYGILITPECEISPRIKEHNNLDFLTFHTSDINDYLQRNNTFARIRDAFKAITKESKKDNLRKIFNNDDLSTHVLPSFPVQDGIYNQVIVINFKTAFKTKSEENYQHNRTNYKLNAPYIYQLRQRYISFFGRYGVPAIPKSLRDYNLNA